LSYSRTFFACVARNGSIFLAPALQLVSAFLTCRLVDSLKTLAHTVPQSGDHPS
jgi:hypothetical protein